MKYIRIFLILLVFSAGVAQAEEKYVSIANVDITAANASIAKERAMAQANRKAVYDIAPEFTDERGMKVLESLTDEQILYFIKEATVLEEKSSDVRYIASLKISVHGDILHQYLQEKGVSEELQLAEINVLYVFSGLQDWLNTEQTIRTIKNVEEVKTVAMAKQKVQFKVLYRGATDVFIASAEQKGLRLLSGNGLYTLRKQNIAPAASVEQKDNSETENGENKDGGTQY